MQDNPQALLPKPQLPVVPPPGSRPLSNARHEHYCRLRSLLRPKAQALREAGMRAVKSPQTHSNNSSANLHTYKFHPRKPAETENLRLPSGGERCGYHHQSPPRSRKRASARMRARRIVANAFTMPTLRGAGTFGADFSLGPPSADRFTTETAGGKSR
jgi:hypothetical protein